MTFAELQKAIEDLSQEEQAKLAAWVADRDRIAWDAEIEADFSAGGAGSPLLDSVRQQVPSGKSKPPSEGPHRA
jgi:hypothetical protein